MRDLVERRAILLVNGNMARIGEDNAQVCMHFIFQMLHRQMQHQMHLPEAERPRVALIADEAGYLLSRNVVRQIATHRAAGLDVAIGIQYLGQLGAGAESGSVTEEIRKGVTNLLQSPVPVPPQSDPRDADEVSRIAMALVSTMTQQDPDSRLYRRVGPEVMLNIENYFCLCSWIASGARIGSFIGQTFEMPARPGDGPRSIWPGCAPRSAPHRGLRENHRPADRSRAATRRAQRPRPTRRRRARPGRSRPTAAGGRRSAAPRPEWRWIERSSSRAALHRGAGRPRPSLRQPGAARVRPTLRPRRACRTPRRGGPRPPRCASSRWWIA